MVKQGSSIFSAASVAKGSVVLSRTIEKNFALEAEISRLRHHVSVLSRRLHLVTLERDGLVDMVAPTVFMEGRWGETPLTDEKVASGDEGDEATPSVAESLCPSVAMVEVAEEEAGEEEEDVATLSVAGEESEEEAAQGVAGAGVERRHSVANEDDRSKAELIRDARMEKRLKEMARDVTRRWDEERKRREENATGRVVDVERVPEMAEGCNRFEMDLVERVDSVPEPLIPSGVGDLIRDRTEELEEDGGWPALGNPGLSKIEGGEERMRLGSSGDEDAVIGGVIVAGGASQKARNAARKKKRKNRRSEASGRSGGG